MRNHIKSIHVETVTTNREIVANHLAYTHLYMFLVAELFMNEKLVRQYERKHDGHIVKLTDYSLVFESTPKKDGSTTTHIVYASYFFTPNSEK